MTLQALNGEAALFVLETVRITGVVLSAPILWAQAPMRVRGALVLMLGLVCHGGARIAPTALDSLGRIAVVAPTELLVGIAMGLVVRLSVATVEVAGDAISPLMGLGAATLFDPQAQAQETALTRLLRLLLILLALFLGIHRVLLGSLVASFHVVPVGSVVDAGLALPDLLRLSSGALATGVRLALPVVATLLLTQLGLAFISRAAPSLQIFSVGFAISLIAGTLVLLISLPELAREIEVDLSQVGVRIELVLTAMAAT
jgi:flagellar biosynthetic protein FliR